jgi:hypothetical protein
VRQILKKAGKDIREVEAYKNVLKISFEEKKTASAGGETKDGGK